MADHSPIEWTDATWNPITGCSVISPGCTNCYAMRLAGSRLAGHPSREGLTRPSRGGPVWTGEVRLNEGWLDQPLTWPAKVRRIFVCAHGDPFHEAVPDAWIDKVFAVMALASHREFQVLTKRSARLFAYLNGWPEGAARFHHVADQAHRLKPELPTGWNDGFRWQLQQRWPLRNVLIGVSVEDQARADERRSHLERVAALGWPTFVSYEPALGPVDWAGWEFLRWLIAGGESGPGARPMHPDWARAARDWCAAHGVPFLFKQWGAWKEAFHDQDGPHVEEVEYDDPKDELPQSYLWGIRTPGWLTPDGRFFRRLDQLPPETAARLMERLGKKAAGRRLDGVMHDGFPSLGARA